MGGRSGLQRVMPGLASDQREAHPIGWPVIHYDLEQKHKPDQLDSFLRNLEVEGLSYMSSGVGV